MNYNEALQGNNAALEEILEEVKALPQGSGGVQTDYLQNDPTAPDYLKHRPFGDFRQWKCVEEPKMCKVWDESMVTAGNALAYIRANHLLNFSHPEGTMYKIIVGGDAYVAPLRFDRYGESYIGNGGLFSDYMDRGAPDTGEDILVFNGGVDYLGITTRKTMVACEVSVHQLESGKIEPIHPKYLPPEVFTATPEQMAQLAAAVLDVLEGKVITGYIDSENDIIFVNLPDLPDGKYAVKFKMTDGSTVDIGTMPPEGSGKKNLADPASADWLVDHRLSTSGGGGSALAGHTLTNFIPAKMGDTLRVKGLNLKAADVNGKPSAVGIYKADKSYQANFVLTGMGGTSSADSAGHQVTQNGDVFEYTILMDDTGAQRANAQTAYIRIDGVLMDGYAKEDVIITINEPIE